MGRPAKSFEETATLPERAEIMMANAILDGRCDQQFVLDVRRMLLPAFSVECPDCKGKGLVFTSASKIEQVGCDACGGTGKRNP